MTLRATDNIQYRARQLTETIAVALEAGLLLEAGNARSVMLLPPGISNHPRRTYGTARTKRQSAAGTIFVGAYVNKTGVVYALSPNAPHY